MAYTADFGEANPLVADIAKGATIAIVTAILTGSRIPDPYALAIPAASLTIYWYTVHRFLVLG